MFDLAHALENPATLDEDGLFQLGREEAESAAFSEQDKLVVATRDDKEPTIGVWDLAAKSWISRKSLGEPMGTMFAAGSRAFALSSHPKVVDLGTGRVLERWPHISTGCQRGPFNINGSTPQAAFDPTQFRLAVTTETGITVLHPTPPCTDPELGTL